MIVSYDVPLQGISINQQIVQTLLAPAAAGESKTAYYTPLTLLTKENDHARAIAGRWISSTNVGDLPVPGTS